MNIQLQRLEQHHTSISRTHHPLFTPSLTKTSKTTQQMITPTRSCYNTTQIMSYQLKIIVKQNRTKKWERKKTPPGYTALDKSQQDDTANDHAYQKLVKYDSDYVIPAESHRQTEAYEEVGKEKTPPGYTELDATKRQEDNTGYQKLIRE